MPKVSNGIAPEKRPRRRRWLERVPQGRVCSNRPCGRRSLPPTIAAMNLTSETTGPTPARLNRCQQSVAFG